MNVSDSALLISEASSEIVIDVDIVPVFIQDICHVCDWSIVSWL